MAIGTSIATQAILNSELRVDNMIQPDLLQDDILMALYNMHKFISRVRCNNSPGNGVRQFFLHERKLLRNFFGHTPGIYMAEHFKALPLIFSQMANLARHKRSDCIEYFGSFMKTITLKIIINSGLFFITGSGMERGNIFGNSQDEKATLVTVARTYIIH